MNEPLIERLFWLIRLRWIAVIGVILAILFANLIIELDLPVFALYSICFVLAVYNLVFYFITTYLKRSSSQLFGFAGKIANIQISLDLLILASLIHFSGGIENPFIFYFIFHMIIASILLSPFASFLQAAFAVSLFIFMALLEYLGVLPHYSLQGFLPATLYNDPFYILGISFVFISTLFIAVYMATSISSKLKEREKSLAEANESLEEKDRIKSEYVLRVSHDIKEHIAAIESCIDPVVEGITGTLNDKQKDLLGRANRRASRLLFFVNALLEITRIKLTKKLRMETFSFREVLEAIIEDISAKTKSKQQKFLINISQKIDKIKGVRVYLEEAILNLLHNSVKYTPVGGTISLNVVDQSASLLVQIEDNGIGIPNEDLPHIFDEFYRAKKARQLEVMGSGLGTSIAKKIVELHNGRIWVKSKEGQGTKFFIELPKKEHYDSQDI
jgi:signal transduction histidine kinase